MKKELLNNLKTVNIGVSAGYMIDILSLFVNDLATKQNYTIDTSWLVNILEHAPENEEDMFGEEELEFINQDIENIFKQCIPDYDKTDIAGTYAKVLQILFKDTDILDATGLVNSSLSVSSYAFTTTIDGFKKILSMDNIFSKLILDVASLEFELNLIELDELLKCIIDETSELQGYFQSTKGSRFPKEDYESLLDITLGVGASCNHQVTIQNLFYKLLEDKVNCTSFNDGKAHIRMGAATFIDKVSN